eukprot:4807566-Prymnesium_polylepis.1
MHAPPARGRCRLASRVEGGGRRPSCALRYGRPMRRCGRGRPDYHQLRSSVRRGGRPILRY